MLLLQFVLLFYVLLWGRKYVSTKYILWLDFTLWCILLSADMANPGGLGIHYAEFLLFLIATLCYLIAFRKQENAKRMELENAALQEQLNRYEQQIQTITEQNAKVCRIKHDLKNQFVHLSSLASNGEWEQVQAILDETLGELIEQKYINTGNVSLDSLFNYKIALAKRNNIKVETLIRIPEDNIYNDSSIILSLGNLLDNAIEASMKLPIEERLISIKMERKDSRTLLLVSNSFHGELRTDKEGTVTTTKKDTLLHGIGLKNVKRIMEGKGDFEYHTEGNLFVAKIVFY